MAVQLRPTTPADYPRIVAIQTQHRIPEPNTVEDLERQSRIRPEGLLLTELSAENEDGLLVGYGAAEGGKFTKPGHFHVNLRVDADWQRRGIGDMLFRAFAQWAAENGARVLEATVREESPDSRAWAERRGFAVTQHLFESKLDLARFDPAPFAAARAAAEAAGMRFAPIVELVPDVDMGIERLLAFLMPIQQDIPGMAGQPLPPVAVVKQILAEDPKFDPHGIIIAVDGDTWAGVAWVQRQNSGVYYNNITGVAREYRGRHLSTALKLVSIDYVRRKGAPSIRTNNDSTNERMLAVNRKLGYEPLPGVWILEREVAE